LWNLTNPSGTRRVKQQHVCAPEHPEETEGARVVATCIFDPLPAKPKGPFNEDQGFFHLDTEPLVERRLIDETLQLLE
jgi:hypothetical protein